MTRAFRIIAHLAAPAVLVLSLCATPLRAADASASMTLNAGTLTVATLSGSITFATTLTGQSQALSSTTAPTFQIVDATGTGNGWNLTFTATDFSTGGATPSVIPVSSFGFAPSGGTISVVDGQGGVDAPAETGTSQAPLSSTTGLKVLSAGLNKGMGTYNYTPQASGFRLTVAAQTRAGTYTSTLTATVAIGP